MRDLNKYVDICKKELDSIGIQYRNPDKWIVSGKLTKSLGYSEIYYDGISNKTKGIISKIPKIVISKRILNDKYPEKYLKETIIHELIHTCDGCTDHGSGFKRIARIINKELGYNIKRCASPDEAKIYHEMYKPKERKYSIECPKCGSRWNYKIKCNTYKHPERYRCSRCKATLRQIN